MTLRSASTLHGASVIAQSLQQLGVKCIFGLVGIPVVQIAEAAIACGIQFIGCRNEQAASYAATAYGYLTGQPGVCLVVGGPGVLHAIAGVGNASANRFPLLLLAGSCETSLVNKGAFQELDAVCLLRPHTKFASRIADTAAIPETLSAAYQIARDGTAGCAFVDFPAEIISAASTTNIHLRTMSNSPRVCADPGQIAKASQLLKTAQAPLIVIGKGAAFAQAEGEIRQFIEKTRLPFLPTPMGKGVMPDSHPLNMSSARSAVLSNADVVLVLGARLNWILHFGEAPKWNHEVTFIHVDLRAEDLGRTLNEQDLRLWGCLPLVVEQLDISLQGWQCDHGLPRMQEIQKSMFKNERKATELAKKDSKALTYHRAFDIIKQTLNGLTPPEDGDVVYVSEGANTMDISRSVFTVEQPRLRLDAGTHATMGIGPAYAMAAHCTYNMASPHESNRRQKKIVCFEGDSAFGFSMAEVETMARYGMDCLIFVMNNGGIYHGDSDHAEEWLAMRSATIKGDQGAPCLRSTSLGWQVGYEKVAEMSGGLGFVARTAQELEDATEAGFRAGVPVVVNVMIESGAASKLEFAWQAKQKSAK